MTSQEKPFLHYIHTLDKKEFLKLMKEIPEYIETSDTFALCNRCANDMHNIYIDKDFPYELADNPEASMKVLGVPKHECRPCRRIQPEFRVSLAIQRIINEEVALMVEHGEQDKIPEVVDFSVFIEEK